MTLLPEVVTLEMVRPLRLIAAFFFMRLKVNATSAGVSGVPLFHFTPWRIAKVIALPPLLQLKDVARNG